MSFRSRQYRTISLRIHCGRLEQYLLDNFGCSINFLIAILSDDSCFWTHVLAHLTVHEPLFRHLELVGLGHFHAAMRLDRIKIDLGHVPLSLVHLDAPVEVVIKRLAILLESCRWCRHSLESSHVFGLQSHLKLARLASSLL